jgi:hypothetical protein
LVLHCYWTNACQSCAIKHNCTTGKERRITRWEHEHILEAVQRRLDEHPEKMRQRRETVEHPFGTIKARMGATHFLMKTLPRVAAEMALHVLAYNLTRVMNIVHDFDWTRKSRPSPSIFHMTISSAIPSLRLRISNNRSASGLRGCFESVCLNH